MVPLDELSPAAAIAAVLGGPRRRDRRSRVLTITLLVSLGLHLAALAVFLRGGGVKLAEGPENLATVELVMDEHKGEPHPETAPATQGQAPLEPAQRAETPVEERKVTGDAAAEAPAKAQNPGMTISLHGTDSPSDAQVLGGHVIPAAPDAVFHNRPPEYPPEAAMNGEHGTVVVLIHVAPSGRTASVDVTRSSGSALLDQAARDAVTRWRFLPAVKDGQPVVSSFEMGFVFSLE